MTMTKHYITGDRTLCGVRASLGGALKTTQVKGNVTCRRCLKSLSEPTSEEPEWAKLFREGITQIADAMRKTMTIQARMSRVAGMIYDANKAGDGLMLDREEVEALTMLIYLLNTGKK